jgi:hypothetical protein
MTAPDADVFFQMPKASDAARGIVKDKLKRAVRWFPADWTETSNRHRLDVKVRPEGRASCSPDGATISMVRGNGSDVYAHELVHRLQSPQVHKAEPLHPDRLGKLTSAQTDAGEGVPDEARRWLMLDEAFRRRRDPAAPTPLSEKLPKHNYRPDEFSKSDKFGDPYVGKVYPVAREGYTGASEVSTMGVQMLANGSLPLTKKWKSNVLDMDFIHYTLGMIATVGRREVDGE